MNKKGSSTSVGIIVILAIVFGALVGAMYMRNISGGSVPKIHEAIAYEVGVYDRALNLTAVCVFVKQSRILMRFDPEVTTAFAVGTIKYELSEWTYYVLDSPVAYMNVWGPAEDEITFLLQVVRITTNSLKLICPDGVYILDDTMPTLTIEVQMIPSGE